MSYNKGDEPVPGFRLQHLLGRGGFGEVWKATAPGGAEVALKFISLENKQGFKEFRAIRTVKHIRHSHLIPLVAIWLKDTKGNLFEDTSDDDSLQLKAKAGELIIAMGLGDKHLLDRLKECQEQGLKGIPPEELLDYMEGTARAIDFLNKPQHDIGTGRIAIQHCDIKPQNIMIVGDSVQVCDFGLARVLGDPRVTQASMSAPYSAPEMITETRPSQWSDQYSLAVTYVELRTGRLPFENLTPAGMMYAHVQGKLDLSQLTPEEQTVIRRGTAVDPTKRYPTTVEMVKDLRRAFEGMASKTTGPRLSKTSEELSESMEIVPGYKLVRPLGRGGYGAVWQALAPGGKSVALKVIRNLEGLSGKQEYKALEVIKGLEHNHLLELHAYWLLDKEGAIIPDHIRHTPQSPPASSLVIATKLASKNLLQRLTECQEAGDVGIPPDELISYMRQAALAIDYLNEESHEMEGRVVSIQHRDIKPENILLARDGTVKVGDFGLARVLEGTSGAVHGDSTGYTPQYAAPELFENKVSHWTDQYALAITYYKLRSGTMPFDATGSLYDLMMTHVEGKLDLGLLPDTERMVIARATSLTPEERYESCMELVSALERALSADFPPEEEPARPVKKPKSAPHITPPRKTPPVAEHPSPAKYRTPPPPRREEPAADFGTMPAGSHEKLAVHTEQRRQETPRREARADTDPAMEPTSPPHAKRKAPPAPPTKKDQTVPIEEAPPAPVRQRQTPGAAAGVLKPRGAVEAKKGGKGAAIAVAGVLVVGAIAGGAYFILKPGPDKLTNGPTLPTKPEPTKPGDNGNEGSPKITRADTLARAEKLLKDGDADAAVAEFEKVKDMADAKPGYVTAIIRSSRPNKWDEARNNLGALPESNPNDKVKKLVYQLLIEDHPTASSKDDKKLVAMIVKLKKPEDLTTSLHPKEKELVEQTIQGVWERTETAAKNVPHAKVDEKDPFQKPYQPQEADQVFQKLDRLRALAEVIKKPVSEGAQIDLALAAWYKTQPDKTLAKELTDTLLKDPAKLGTKALALLFAEAHGLGSEDDTQRRVEAFHSYQALITQGSEKKLWENLEPKTVYDNVFKPAADLGDKVRKIGGASDKQYGRVLGASAQFAEANWEKLKDKLTANAVYTSFEKAARFAEDFEYLVSSVVWGLRLEELPELAESCNNIIAQEGDKNPRGFYLRGAFLLKDAAKKSAIKPKLDQMNRGVRDLEKAEGRMKGNPAGATQWVVLTKNELTGAYEQIAKTAIAEVKKLLESDPSLAGQFLETANDAFKKLSSRGKDPKELVEIRRDILTSDLKYGKYQEVQQKDIRGALKTYKDGIPTDPSAKEEAPFAKEIADLILARINVIVYGSTESSVLDGTYESLIKDADQAAQFAKEKKLADEEAQALWLAGYSRSRPELTSRLSKDDKVNHWNEALKKYEAVINKFPDSKDCWHCKYEWAMTSYFFIKEEVKTGDKASYRLIAKRAGEAIASCPDPAAKRAMKGLYDFAKQQAGE
jgi:serine/threonine protein kinase